MCSSVLSWDLLGELLLVVATGRALLLIRTYRDVWLLKASREHRDKE